MENQELDQNQTRKDSTPLNVFMGMKRQIVKKVCQECGAEFDALELGQLSRRYCNSCYEVITKQEETDRRAHDAAVAESRFRELIAAASIPKLWRGVTFESSDPNLRRAPFKVARRYAESFSTEAGTLVFYSKGFGSGKTHLAVCIANHVLHALRRPVLFKKARDLLLEIRRTFSERDTGTEFDILDSVLSVELLVLDDVGVDTPSPWIESTYWTIFDRRLEWQLPTVVTTNYPLEAERGEVSLGERIGYGALSRLSQLCKGQFLDMSGLDLR